MEEGQPTHRLALPGGGHHEADLVAQQLRRPPLVPVAVPARPPEQHYGQLRGADQLEMVEPFDQASCLLGHPEDGLDCISVGIGPVDGQREPQGKSSGPPGQVIGVVAGVPLVRPVGVEHVEVRGVLGVDGLGQTGFAVDQGGTVEGGEEPLVRVDHERIGQFDALEPVSCRRGEQGRSPIGPVHVEPHRACPGHGPHPGQVVDDPGVGGPSGGYHGDHVVTPRVVLQDGAQGGTGEPVVLARHQQGLDAQHLEGLSHRGVGLVADGDQRPLRYPAVPPVGRGVAGHHQRRQVAGRAAGDETPARTLWQSGQSGQHPEGLVLGGHRAGRFHP